MNTEAIRAKFEEWANVRFVDPNLGGFRTGNTGDSFSYNDDDIEIAWESWQASHQQAVKGYGSGEQEVNSPCIKGYFCKSC